MKICIILILANSFTNIIFAQKNSLLVYGNIELFGAKEKATLPNDPATSQNVRSQFSFSPAIGYQFNDNFTIGIKLSSVSGKAVETNSAPPNPINENIYKYNFYNIGPFLRYSKKLNNFFILYGQIEGGPYFGKALNSSTGYPDLITKYNHGFKGAVYPAFGIILKRGFLINANFGGLYYEGYTIERETEKRTSSTFSINFGSTFNFGISKNFSLKQKR